MDKTIKFIRKLIHDYLIPVIIAVILYLLINRFLLYKIGIPSASMYPTLKIGDQAFATRIYSEKSIKRGDILVFYSEELKQRLIKRVIGLPGDKVKIDNKGQVFVNGIKLKEDYVKSKSKLTGDFKVPEHDFVFLGDNRSISYDSRYWKHPYIKYKDIQGKARVIVFPFNRFKFLS